jgi:hypothetical protein
VRILVCGSRTWTDKKAIRDALNRVTAIGGLGEMAGCVIDQDTLTLIHGCAPGADRLSEEVWRELWGRPPLHPENIVLRFPAQWDKYGRAAGAIRNKQMLDESQPELVLAFWDGHSRGTKNMIELAKRAGVPVEVVIK